MSKPVTYQALVDLFHDTDRQALAEQYLVKLKKLLDEEIRDQVANSAYAAVAQASETIDRFFHGSDPSKIETIARQLDLFADSPANPTPIVPVPPELLRPPIVLDCKIKLARSPRGRFIPINPATDEPFANSVLYTATYRDKTWIQRTIHEIDWKNTHLASLEKFRFHDIVDEYIQQVVQGDRLLLGDFYTSDNGKDSHTSQRWYSQLNNTLNYSTLVGSIFTLIPPDSPSKKPRSFYRLA